MGSQDTEITLGAGKMLAVFFGLVALCGLFFGLGFSLGRGSVRPLTTAEQGQSPSGATLRSSALKSAVPASQPPADNMTFYKAVEQKDATSQLAPSDPPKEANEKDAPKPAQNNSAPPDPMTAIGASYFVQVAAVTKQDDAQALVEALKKKQYAAFTSNTSATDKFFHVQVGPFADLKDAEATKAKLIGDGYNPILKK
jgi:cell division septation protein DedD